MIFRLAALGGLGYAAYQYYTRNREQVDGALRRFTQGGEESAKSSEEASIEVAGGPLSDEARLVHAGEAPIS